jgi:hypothetical protein
VNGRDAGIDTVRAVAIAGVVGGHWLVTALTVDDAGVLRQSSPLAAMPHLAPLTWLLQTLGLFFFAGGFAAARALDRRAAATPARRGGRRRLIRAVLLLLGFWAAALTVAAALGTPAGTLRTVATLVVSPLWFLLPYLALRALTRPARRHAAALVPLAAGGVALSDAGLAPGALAVLCAWAVPWLLGVLVADERLRIPPVVLAAGGALALAALVRLGGYPVSAVGVPGEGRSNLAPPSPAAVALAVAQIGVVLLLRRRITRATRPVAALNRAALPVYLTHQSVLVGVTAAAAALHPRTPGLLTAPDGPGWVAYRAVWLPVLAAVLAALIATRRGRPARIKFCLRGTLPCGSAARRPTEVIAVRDSDPPSRGRAARQRV